MRGKPTGHECSYQEARNIPAYAGKTRCSWWLGVGGAEHPRVCGENSYFTPNFIKSSGTSPRMRGKLRYWSASRVLLRNIPAYAGKTLASRMQTWESSEHPRVCGENAVKSLTAPGLMGTSPRMRGKPRLHLREPTPIRNIPAYAGKTGHSELEGGCF